MKTDNVIATKQREDKSIELTLSDPFTGETQKKRYAAIRGGISWPTSKAPAYFCIVGQEYVAPAILSKKSPAGPRVLLAEYKSDLLSMDGFYRKLTDLAEQMMCRDFYVILPEERFACGYQNDLEAVALEQKSKVYLSNAFDADSFVLGISRVKGDVDKNMLTIPDDSIVYSQLQSMTRQDLENSPEEVFYSINALRHVISSFYRDPPVIKLSRDSRLSRAIDLAQLDTQTTHMSA